MKTMSVATIWSQFFWGWIVLAMVGGMTACSSGEGEPMEIVESPTTAIPLDKVAICMYPLVYVREEPSGTNERITEIAYFEEVEMLPEKAEKGNEKYMKVRLSDRQVGWVKEFPFEKHARLAVLLAESETYRRPQTMTIMDDKIEAGEIVAVILGRDSSNLVDGWYKVSSARKNHKGWIRSGDQVSFSPTHIKPAFLIFKALQEGGTEDRKERLQELAENPIITNSPFEPLINEHLAELSKDGGDLPASNPEVQQGEKVFIVGSQVPVLKSPGTEDGEENVVKELDRNAEVTVLEITQAPSNGSKNQIWFKIEHEGTEGWVNGRLTNRRPTE